MAGAPAGELDERRRLLGQGAAPTGVDELVEGPSRASPEGGRR